MALVTNSILQGNTAGVFGGGDNQWNGLDSKQPEQDEHTCWW
jgi:hypothetical protein